MGSSFLSRLIALSRRHLMGLLQNNICGKMNCRFISLCKLRALVCSEKKWQLYIKQGSKKKKVECAPKITFT